MAMTYASGWTGIDVNQNQINDSAPTNWDDQSQTSGGDAVADETDTGFDGHSSITDGSDADGNK